MLITIIGLLAAALTNAFLHPASEKIASSGINRGPLVQNCCGPCSWTCLVNRVCLLKGDFVIIVANAVGLALVAR